MEPTPPSRLARLAPLIVLACAQVGTSADNGAFSVVIVKVKNSGDVEKVRSEMEKGLDPGKEICMIADAVCAVAKGDYIIGVIGTEDDCKTIPEIFANIVK